MNKNVSHIYEYIFIYDLRFQEGPLVRRCLSIYALDYTNVTVIFGPGQYPISQNFLIKMQTPRQGQYHVAFIYFRKNIAGRRLLLGLYLSKEKVKEKEAGSNEREKEGNLAQNLSKWPSFDIAY